MESVLIIYVSVVVKGSVEGVTAFRALIDREVEEGGACIGGTVVGGAGAQGGGRGWGLETLPEPVW